MSGYKISFVRHHRLWRCQLPKLESMVMPNVTLLVLTSSLPRSLKILFHLPTTAMYGFPGHLLIIFAFFFFKFLKCVNGCSISSQVPHVNRTDYQLIDISEDGFVCNCFPFYVGFHYLFIIIFKDGLTLLGHY